MFINSKFFTKIKPYPALYFMITMLAGALLAILFDRFSTAIGGRMILVSDLSSDKRIYLDIIRGALINWLISFMVLHFYKMKENEQTTLELEHLKQANLQAHLSSLKRQLSPHFMFNTLNTLTSLSQEQLVKDYVDELANVYRYLLSHQKDNLVTIRQELKFIESYLYIIKTRLEKAIEITVQVNPDKLEYSIPPLTLQLLIENAIKHNVAADYNPLQIRIFTISDALIVNNNINPKKSIESSSGIGLNNISQRYQLLFNKDIIIQNKPDLFEVKLPLII
jgi:two-component system, LytTR family, sensor kinase